MFFCRRPLTARNRNPPPRTAPNRNPPPTRRTTPNRNPPPPRKEMNGPPDINDILNNMSNSPRRTNIDMDLNSNFSESDAEAIKHLDIKTGSNNKRSVNLDI